MTFIPAAESSLGMMEFAFGDSPELADELLALVLEGKKIATCDEADSEEVFKVGERQVVLNGKGGRVCVIETTAVERVKFGDVTAAHAAREGEGDLSLKFWRDVHVEYFTRTGTYEPDMLLDCITFKLVEVF